METLLCNGHSNLFSYLKKKFKSSWKEHLVIQPDVPPLYHHWAAIRGMHTLLCATSNQGRQVRVRSYWLTGDGNGGTGGVEWGWETRGGNSVSFFTLHPIPPYGTLASVLKTVPWEAEFGHRITVPFRWNRFLLLLSQNGALEDTSGTSVPVVALDMRLGFQPGHGKCH